MVAHAHRLPSDELRFAADALIATHSAILTRYDGRLMEADLGAAHLAAQQTRALLAEYRRIKKGEPS